MEMHPKVGVSRCFFSSQHFEKCVPHWHQNYILKTHQMSNCHLRYCSEKCIKLQRHAHQKPVKRKSLFLFKGGCGWGSGLSSLWYVYSLNNINYYCIWWVIRYDLLCSLLKNTTLQCKVLLVESTFELYFDSLPDYKFTWDDREHFASHPFPVPTEL